MDDWSNEMFDYWFFFRDPYPNTLLHHHAYQAAKTPERCYSTSPPTFRQRGEFTMQADTAENCRHCQSNRRFHIADHCQGNAIDFFYSFEHRYHLFRIFRGFILSSTKPLIASITTIRCMLPPSHVPSI